MDVLNSTTPGTMEPMIYDVLLSELIAAGYPPKDLAAERVSDGLVIRLTFSPSVEMNRGLLRTIAAYTYYIFSELSSTRSCTPGSFKSVTVEVRQEGSELVERIDVDSQSHAVYYALGFVAGLVLKKGMILGDVRIQTENDELHINISLKELKTLRKVLRESKAETWRYLALSLYTSPICSTARSCGLKLVLIIRGGFRKTATLICV